jgi:hypothetical protein
VVGSAPHTAPRPAAGAGAAGGRFYAEQIHDKYFPVKETVIFLKISTNKPCNLHIITLRNKHFLQNGWNNSYGF